MRSGWLARTDIRKRLTCRMTGLKHHWLDSLQFASQLSTLLYGCTTFHSHTQNKDWIFISSLFKFLALLFNTMMSYYAYFGSVHSCSINISWGFQKRSYLQFFKNIRDPICNSAVDRFWHACMHCVGYPSKVLLLILLSSYSYAALDSWWTYSNTV